MLFVIRIILCYFVYLFLFAGDLIIYTNFVLILWLHLLFGLSCVTDLIGD